MRKRIGPTTTGRAVRRSLQFGCVLFALQTGLVDAGWTLDVRCERCNAVIPEKAFFCTACGLAASARDGIYCWRCGLKLPSDAQFCSRCGSDACTHAHAHVASPGGMASTLDDTRTGSAELRVPRPEMNPTEEPETIVPLTDFVADTESLRVGANRDTSDPWSPHPSSPGPADATNSPNALPAAALHENAAENAGENTFIHSPVSLRPQSIFLPPRLFDSPTGDILPSLAIHAGAGLGFGFSDAQERTRRWVVSFGLGGAGEAVMASSNITHLAAPESQPLLGLRLRVPVRWMGAFAEKHVKLAFNVAATDDNTFSTSVPFFDLDGMMVSHLSYKHHETTVGIAGTYRMERTRLHAIVHWTDLRFEEARFATPSGGSQTGVDEKDVHTSFGLGLDVQANPKTYFLAEVRTAPQVNFSSQNAQVQVASQTEFTTGLRFFLDPLLALDANVNIDDEALGLADMQIGFGIHLILEPRKVR